MDSGYPDSLDGDRQIPRVDDNITEVGSDAINGLRSAVFNIEETLGLNPQGIAADVATRLSQSLSPDGSIKASALVGIGLIALPIVNSMVASNAGFEESKLDLDYGTVQLKTWIDENRVRIISLENQLAIDINNLAQHTAHPSTFGRHRTSDIDGYQAPYASYNLQGIITDIKSTIDDHIADPTGAHAASAISVDNSNFLFATGTDGQTVFEELDELGVRALVEHQDNQHSNGILRTQEVVEPGSTRNTVVVPEAAINTSTAGSDAVQFTAVQPLLAQASRWDVIDIAFAGNIYSFLIKEIDTTTDTVTFVGTLPITVNGATATATIYRSSEETIEPAVLALTIRQADMIQLVHPNAPYILSNGAAPRALSAIDGYSDIRIQWTGAGGGDTGDIDLFTEMGATYTLESTWTPENVVAVLNDIFTDEHYPLIAFSYKGEIGIAFDEPDGSITIAAPLADSAWDVLGFAEGDVADTLCPRRFYIDGYSFDAIREVVNTIGEVEIGSPNLIENIPVDLVALGLSADGLVRVGNTTDDDGTYVFDALTPNTLTINEHPNFDAGDTPTVKIYADYFYADPAVRTLYELFVDGYEFNTAQLRGAERVEYVNTPVTGDDPETWFDIVAISRSFNASANKRIFFDQAAGTVELGNRDAGVTVTEPGDAITLPTSNEEGFRFKLYDENNTDYLELVIVSGAYLAAGADNGIDIDILERLTEEKFIQLATVLHNKTTFKHLTDTRSFGNVGRQDVRDDYTRDTVSYPRSLLRGGGVIYGMSQESTVVGSNTITIQGGQVLANGIIFTLDTKSFNVPLGEDLTYNVYVDGEGVLRVEADDQYVVANNFTTPSVEEIIASTDKTIIAQIDTDCAPAAVISAVRDLRRFVNNLDNKIDLIVEENDITHGSFASLHAATNYINASGNLPIPTRIRVRGTIDLEITAAVDTVILPAGVMLEGDNLVDSIINVTNNTALSTIIPGNGCTIKDLGFETDSATLTGAFIGGLGSDVVGLRVERCRFVFNTVDASNYAIAADDMSVSKISNCMFTQPGRGVYCDNSMTNSVISDSAFNDVVDNAIYLVGASSVVISGCMVTKSTGADANTAFISITNSTETIIEKNILSTTSAVAALGSMIAVIDDADSTTNIQIKNNILKNTGTTTVGIANGINMVASSYGGIQDTIINGNTVWGFYGADASHGILGTGITESIISNNHVSLSRFALKLTDCGLFVIDGNYFVGEENNSIVVLDWTEAFEGGQSIFSNNLIVSNENTFLGQDMVAFVETAGTLLSCVVHGNCFEIINTINSTAAMLKVEGYYFIVNDNKFDAGAVTFNSGTSPVEISGSYNLITDNSFMNILSAVSGMVGDTGTGNVDINNKGQTYYVPISLTRGDFSAWTKGFTLAGIHLTYILIGTTDTTAIEFTNADIPAGATLLTAEVLMITSNTADFTVYWDISDWDETGVGGSTIAGPVVPLTTNFEILTLTPVGGQELDDNTIHSIVIKITGSGTREILGLRLKYIL